MHGLILVDMQGSFVDEVVDEDIILKCKNLIKKAKENFEPIFAIRMVNYHNDSSNDNLIDDLRKEICNYSFHFFVDKFGLDGSKQLDELVKRRCKQWEIDSFILCGAYLDQCVLATAKGLKELGYTVKIIREACVKSSLYHRFKETEHGYIFV